ncbi:MAG: hypothetical protein J6X88_05910 [Bacteroidales bacterium]|nr:hypothetical protein [Bacteroidales bacterium]
MNSRADPLAGTLAVPRLFPLFSPSAALPFPPLFRGLFCSSFVLRLFFDCIPFSKRRRIEEQTKNNRRRNEGAPSPPRGGGETANNAEETCGETLFPPVRRLRIAEYRRRREGLQCVVALHTMSCAAREGNVKYYIIIVRVKKKM